MRNNILFLSALSVIVIVSLIILWPNIKKSPFDQTAQSYKPGVSVEVDKAVQSAQTLYAQKKAEGMDFSSGPCLSNDLMANWVVDIVHSPRVSVDDQPENQCRAYLEGRAKHFVELDTKGRLVRVH